MIQFNSHLIKYKIVKLGEKKKPKKVDPSQRDWNLGNQSQANPGNPTKPTTHVMKFG